MFIYCTENAKDELFKEGYKFIKQHGNTFVFMNDNKKLLSKEISDKVIISSKLTF